MNRTIVFVTFALLAALALAGSIILLLVRPDASATFTSFVIVVLGLVVSAAGTFYALDKQSQKIDTVVRQTNGTLSALREENARLAKENSELNRQLPPT